MADSQDEKITRQDTESSGLLNGKITRRKAIGTAAKVGIAAAVAAVAVGGAEYAILKGPLATTSSTSTTSGTQTILIGSSYAAIAAVQEDRKLAQLTAITDLNQLATDMNSNQRFQLVIQDDQNKPDVALRAYQSMHQDQGISIFAGPQNSTPVFGIKDYADSHGLFILAPASSAATLHIAGDSIFRYYGPDQYAGACIADIMWSQGVKKAIIFNGNDVRGQGITKFFTDEFTSLGGSVGNTIFVDETQPDHTAELNQLASQIKTLGGPDPSVAYYFSLIQEAGWISSFKTIVADPTLLKTRPFFDYSPNYFTSAPDIEDFLVTQKAISLNEAITETYLTKKVRAEFQKAYNRDLFIEAYNAYDAVYAIGLMHLSGVHDGTTARKVFPEISATFAGTTGIKVLDDTGDVATQSFELDVLVKDGGNYTFKAVGDWDGLSKKITYNGTL